MVRNALYYRIKPLVPRHLRLAVRQWFTVRKREAVRDIWPILPGSEKTPEGWRGWPDGKRFAVVLTHDVEGITGLKRCRALMDLEKSLGFRSSFNLIPEGEYLAGQQLREELTSNGFEVGVHDLYHNGRLYRSKKEFVKLAARINNYLSWWGAEGFRSGFMLHKLEWLHELDISYDSSTFDTDPFEPQPQGRGTIFPFWVAPDQGSRGGYVELPYTLPQDSTLFLLLRERHPDVWLQKLDWVAKHGGMAMVDTHPDYMAMNGTPPGDWEYPVANYQGLLEYLKSRYEGQYWHALPHEVAAWVREETKNSQKPGRELVPGVTFSTNRRTRSTAPKPKLWVDMDNTPHVPFFEPIVEELEHRGFSVLLTARDAFQVCDLADKKGISYIKVGRHYGKSRLLKASGLAYRAWQLAPIVRREKPVLGISHGARSQLLLGNALRMPTVLLEDYEHARFPLPMRPTWVMAPTVIPDASLCCKTGRIRKYDGIKEEVYAWKLRPDPSVLRSLGLSEDDVIVTVRPPATEAHYHNPESEGLFKLFMERASREPRVRVILLPRNKKQGELIRQGNPSWFLNGKTVVPNGALDGMNLIWYSDLVVSGGGTMNREAAALGVPVYSIFRGTIGAVDHHLEREQRLRLIATPDDVQGAIALTKRPRRALSDVTSRQTLNQIVGTLEEIARRYF